MAGIDYETEYDNRARVPEHPAIFARWDSDAAAYRATMSAEGRAELGVAYGPSERQFVDIFRAQTEGGTLALFIHGGYWRALHPSSFSHMARGLNAHGITVAVAGYDLCPKVSIAEIIDQMRAAALLLWRRLGKRITVFGHSAGGHLAACMLATDWPAHDPKVPADLVPAAYSVSGVFDLTPLIHIKNNADFRLDEAKARAVSPVFWPAPAGRVFDSVVGGAESPEFIRQAKIIVDAWKPATDARYEMVPGANHFTVIEPLSDPTSAMVQRLAAISERRRPA